jgi:putative phosphoesterase
MKLIVISDTHHLTTKVISELKKIKNIDKIIHLGDFVQDGKKISEQLSIPLVAVKGNCDFGDIKAPLETIINVHNQKILICHGHKYGVKYGLDRLYYKALESNVDIVMFGHTHVCLNQRIENILFFNPGSPTLPRGNSKASYGSIDVNENSVESRIIFV